MKCAGIAEITDIKGFTLNECLITIAISAVLITQITPGFFDFIEKQKSRMSIRQMASELTIARSTAMSRSATVTLCGWNELTQRCTVNWNGQRTLFVDVDEDGRLDPKDIRVKTWPPMPEDSQIKTRFFGGRQHFQVRPNGLTRASNGSILYCPPSGNPEHAEQIIISLTGRIRFARDTDNDGIAEGTDGKALICPKPQDSFP